MGEYSVYVFFFGENEREMLIFAKVNYLRREFVCAVQCADQCVYTRGSQFVIV